MLELSFLDIKILSSALNGIIENEKKEYNKQDIKELLNKIDTIKTEMQENLKNAKNNL